MPWPEGKVDGFLPARTPGHFLVRGSPRGWYPFTYASCQGSLSARRCSWPFDLLDCEELRDVQLCLLFSQLLIFCGCEAGFEAGLGVLADGFLTSRPPLSCQPGYGLLVERSVTHTQHVDCAMQAFTTGVSVAVHKTSGQCEGECKVGYPVPYVMASSLNSACENVPSTCQTLTVQPSVLATAPLKTSEGRTAAIRLGFDPLVDASVSCSRGFLDFLCSYLECLARSLLFLYCLAVLRIFARACRLQRGQRASNATIRCARNALKGAPLCLVFGIVMWALPAAQAVKFDYGCHDPEGLRVGIRDVADDPLHHPRIAESGSRNDSGQPTRDTGQDDAFVQAFVFRFQAATKIAKGWVGPHESNAFICKTFQDELFPEQEPLRLVPVFPQPQVDVIMLVDAPAVVTNLLVVPVLFEVHSLTPTRFVATFVGRVTDVELKAAVGDLWIPGGKFYVADSLAHVVEGEIVQLQPGMLVRLLPAATVCRRLHTLDEKLRRPQEFFVETDSSCPDSVEPAFGHIGLVGQWGDWIALPTAGVVGTAALKMEISRACGVPVSDFIPVAPESHPRELVFKGFGIPSLLAVVPKVLAGTCILFVDARALGTPVCALSLPVCYTSLGAVLRLAGGYRPLGVQLQVSGVEGYEEDSETFMPTHRALLTVTTQRPTAVPAGSDDSAALDVSHGCAVGGCDGVQGQFRSTRSADRYNSCAQKESLKADHLALVHCWQPDEATPVMSVERAPPLADVGEDPLDESSAEGDDAEAEPGDALERPTEWRLLVQVFSFQRTTIRRTLFVARGETVADFMVRADILLEPHGQDTDLLLAGGQPHPDRLSFVLAPAWWRQYNLCSFLVASVEVAEPAFAD